MMFTDRKTTTILAALRMMQDTIEQTPEQERDNLFTDMAHFRDGTAPLNADEIEALCEQINLAPENQSGQADHVIDVTVIDPDTQGEVAVSIYKDRTSHAMIGLDGSYLQSLEDSDPVFHPANGMELYLVEGGVPSPGAAS
ncbi:hypothetical protein [Ferrimonas marina]|uniref:Uncharacterized protein n=1 Tax=Ferrimonas marina TaxID=299255 RepID=A0A1M5TX95_9GAMM|nr:hypothetical protein [Ferrimonas marina]SHH55013.1 hypothetical protein SAMN02745129_2302 [Ferrimonas marina]